ncbi:hypothetical protein ACRE_036200 [Hapsidospora chrysogenum ATCC 11550]|uniref:SMP-30/Gluconolactonase/LRE-like region domain-containing protein n=1 Tax=Hapsidospora chrysogenum (strain ATCC 11550 / CBS 779.69 / DSM 880 / IAM 14645 / JCM 23072 / IMI 49137) TaxID=857340 RepID=A0A086T8A0_HAPC1|nr:hypothetical protein ACRE_036200 [Hapsidospora chrysogenum ATCC 11550]
MRCHFMVSLAGLLGAAGATAVPPSPVAKQLYQFPNLTFIENIAVRFNGHLLLNTFDQGRMYTIDPYADNPEPYVVAELSGSGQPVILTGIVEVAPDVFVVSGGDGGDNYDFLNGTAKIAKIDLNNCDDEAPTFTDVASIPSARILNGMVGLPLKPHVVLSVDSINGNLFRIDTSTGAVDIAWHNEKIGPGPNADIVPLGANGLNIHRGYLYFTNSAQQFYGRIKINPRGDPVGDFEELYHFPANEAHVFDDFDMTHRGVSYVCSQRDSFVKITRDGKLRTIIDADSDVKLYSPTSVALSKDQKVAFIVTGGDETQGGQVVAVRL